MTVAADKTIYEYAMIVEDEVDLSYLLTVLLKKNNVVSTCVHSIKEAGEAIRKIRPAIIFLDNHLPDGKGSDFIRSAKTMYPDVKIIMITAHDSPLEINEAFMKGADYFISKPFNSHTIKTTLDFVTPNKQGSIFSYL